MLRLSYMLAWRFLHGARHTPSISTMVKVSFLGIAIGVFALTLVISIMHGFEQATHNTMQNIHPQLLIRSNGKSINVQKLRAMLAQEFPEIVGSAPNASQHVLIETYDNVLDVLILRGVDPNHESMVSTLHTKIIHSVHNTQSLKALLTHNNIIIGKNLADIADIKIGDTITLYYTDELHRTKKIKFNEQPVVVSAIFKTGIEEFDTHLIVSSLDFLKEFFPNTTISELGLRLAPDANESIIINNLQKRTGLDIISWKELYPALVSALKLEKYVMFFLLILVTLVASMNIISLTFMQIIRNRKTIAVLQSLGLQANSVTLIFYITGLLLTSLASITGLIAAFIVGLALQRYHFIELPDVYYVSHLPIVLSWKIFIFIFIVSLILSLCALWIPIRSLKHQSIAHILRFDL